MPISLLKTILSLILLALAGIAVFTMLEVFGRGEKRFNVEKLKRVHRLNGAVFLLLFLIISFFCLGFIVKTNTDLSPRSAFHTVFALSALIILAIKISFVERYRLYYGKVQTMGLILVTMTFLLFGTSGGYYLLITGFGTEREVGRMLELGYAAKDDGDREVKEMIKIDVKDDQESIERGKELYGSKCFSCHDPESTKTIIGPGHKGILENPVLPVSRRPATPENLARQLRDPYENMPSFAYLTDEQVEDIISYMNTL